MDYHWLPVLGEFYEKDDYLVFKGNTREYSNQSGTGKELGADIGNLLFAKSFIGGTIIAEIEFTKISEASSCEIIL